METKIRNALKNLLGSLGWATSPKREGRFIPAELLILRRNCKAAYLVLGFSEEDLKDYEFGIPIIKEGIKVWLDDDPIRDPSSGWEIVRNIDEAVEKLLTGNVEMISLDHDLGDIRQTPYPCELTGMDVVEWMIRNRVFPKVINIHSFNVSAAAQMAQKLTISAPPKEPEIRLWRFETGITTKLEALLEQLK